MVDDAAIIRKIAALLARAEDSASSPAEIAHAILIADKLMRQYNLDRDEVRLRQEEMRRIRYLFNREDSAYANTLIVAIARLAQCQLNGERCADRDQYFFFGLRVDVDYATWLLRASWAVLLQGWKAYKHSPAAKRLIDDGAPPAAIEHHYKLGFAAELSTRIKSIAEQDATSTALVCLKTSLIQQAFGQASSATAIDMVRVKHDLREAFQSGADASKEVGLRQELGARDPVVPLSAPSRSGSQPRQ